MKINNWLIALLILFGFPCSVFGQLNLSRSEIESDYVPGEVLVKFKENVDFERKNKIHFEVESKVHEEISDLGVARVRSKKGENTESLIKKYKNYSEIEYVEPNFYFHVHLTPNDPSFPLQWGLNNTGQAPGGGTSGADVKALNAWNLQTGSSATIVAVIDTGVAYDHPDLVSNMWINTREIPNNLIDDDLNGYIDDVRGWNFISNTNNPYDDMGHGTHVAGIIGATGNNNTGIAGLNWKVRIMPVKVFDYAGTTNSTALANGILYASMMGAKISNNSWGGYNFSQTVYNAIQTAGTRGMLFVASAGNDSNDNSKIPEYPCDYQLGNILCVGATDSNDQLASFSNYGSPGVALGAPGVNIFSTVPTTGNICCSNSSGYMYLSGTSMAAPYVSGAAALILAQSPSLSTSNIINAIYTNTDYKSALYLKFSSSGRLNVYKALQSIVPPPPPGGGGGGGGSAPPVSSWFPAILNLLLN